MDPVGESKPAPGWVGPGGGEAGVSRWIKERNCRCAMGTLCRYG